MSLKEFFTSTEVKDGMTTPSLVEELITLLQKEKDYEVKSAVEATKQHSDIARAIAETKNTNCLDHFIKLGGLRYINTWLNDALKSAADTSADIIEESIALQCRALKKLHIDHEKLISSGILDTVKNLCDHNSTFIKDEAKELLDRWKDVDLIIVSNDAEKVDAFGDDDEGGAMLKTDEDGALLEISDVKPKQIENNNSTDAAHGKDPELKGSEGSLLVEVEHIDTEATDCQMIAPASLDQIDTEGGATSAISNTGDDISKAVCRSAIPLEDIIEVDNSNSLELKKDTGEENLGVHDNTTSGNVTDTVNSISENLEAVNVYHISNTQESGGCSSIADIAMAEQTIPEPKTESNIDCREGATFMKDGLADNAATVLCENSSRLDDIGLEKSLVRESPERNSSRLEGFTASTTTNSDVGPNSRIDEDYSKGSAIQNLARDTKSSAMADMRPDISLDYGTMDALEVARQVAKALEREMVCDGSSENLSDVSKHPGSSDSINEKDSQSGNLSEESSSRLDLSPERSSDREVESSNSEKRDNKSENCMQDVDKTQASKQEVEVDISKDICEFDLNQEVPNENVDFSVNFNQNMGEETDVLTTDNPTSVVLGSRSPVGTSQFAGSHGCKGSVTASAFQYTSPRRDADPHNALPCPPSINAKQKQGAFGIDLNVAEEGDDSNVIPLSEKETSSSTNIMWDGHCVAAAPAKPERLEFDLNTMSDIDDAPLSSSWRFDKQHFSHLNGHLSYPPTSSSSSIQPRVNIDLNEGPSIQSMSSRLHPFFGMSSSQNVDVQKDVKPVISIMGARVEVGRDDSFLGAPPLPNGKYEKHAMETNIAAMGSYLGVGPIGSYGHPSHFGFSNMNAGPNLSFASPLFRPGNTMTYMVDPRVGHVPQMVSQSSIVPPMYAQPPFLMSMAVPPPGLNGAVSPRPNFDLNLGFMTEGGNRQDMASRQLLRDNQGRFIGEHMNLDSQPSSSFGKRKEPDTGWESYPYNMKYHYPPGSR
uniref:TFIIS N-terminal domain-containing protein n=1 Tax=Kalanchoe fedtschenkoi TaxID=63787 RepID=A0A7N0U362_KALFE